MKLTTFIIGLVLFVLGACGFFLLLMRGWESILVYLLAVMMYVGLGIALYFASTWWTREED